MGPRNMKSSLVRLLTPSPTLDPCWALYGPRLYLPALPRLRTSLQRRPFHATPSYAAASFLDLSNLSISRESRFLAKSQGRPRTHFSPHLELIRSSEVDPFTERGPKAEETVYNNANIYDYPGGMSGKPVSMANILEELVHTRAARESAERKLEELQSMASRKQREGELLVMVTVVLFLGLVFRDQLWDSVGQIMHGRAWAALSLPLEQHPAGSLKDLDLGDPPRDHDGSVSTWNDTVASAPVEVHGWRSVLSRLLWASCD